MVGARLGRRRRPRRAEAAAGILARAGQCPCAVVRARHRDERSTTWSSPDRRPHPAATACRCQRQIRPRQTRKSPEGLEPWSRTMSTYNVPEMPGQQGHSCFWVDQQTGRPTQQPVPPAARLCVEAPTPGAPSVECRSPICPFHRFYPLATWRPEPRTVETTMAPSHAADPETGGRAVCYERGSRNGASPRRIDPTAQTQRHKAAARSVSRGRRSGGHPYGLP